MSNEGKVFVTGETCFEVAKDITKPFRVVAGVLLWKLSVQFNVNTYNERYFAATLIEGSIRVKGRSKEYILKPSQQTHFTDNDFTVVPADLDDVAE